MHVPSFTPRFRCTLCFVPPPERTIDVVETAVERLRQRLRSEVTGVPPYLLDLSLDHEVIQRQLCEALQVQMPNLDLRPGSNLRTLVQTASAQLMLETSNFHQQLRYAILPQAVTLPFDAPIEDIGEHGGMAVAAGMSYAAQLPPLSPEMMYQAARTIDRQDRQATWAREYEGSFHQTAVADAVQRIHEIEDQQILETLEAQELGSDEYRNSWGEQWASRRVTVPMFELASNPTINVDEIRSRRFDLLRHDPVPAIIEFLLGWQNRKRAASRVQLVPDKTPSKAPPKTAWEWLLEDEAA